MSRTTVATFVLLALLLPTVPVLAQPVDLSDWSRVRRLPPATAVTVNVLAGGIGNYLTAFADDDTLVLVRPFGKKVPEAVERVIGVIAAHWPALRAGQQVVIDDVKLTMLGIAHAGVPVATVMIVPRTAVSEVRLSGKAGTSSALATAAGLATFIGSAMATEAALTATHSATSLTDYYGHPDYGFREYQYGRPYDPAGTRSRGITSPGPFGHRSARSDSSGVVYRAAEDSGPLSEATMQRILQSVGPLGQKK